MKSKSKERFDVEHSMNLLWESPGGKHSFFGGRSEGANSDFFQKCLPITNLVGLGAGHNQFATALIAHNPDRTSIDTRFDINLLLTDRINYDCVEDYLIKPPLKWMYESYKNKEFHFKHIDPSEVTGQAFGADGGSGSCMPTGIYKILMQLFGLSFNCIRGVNRTAFAIAIILYAFYHETCPSIDEVCTYIVQLRPICEFTAKSQEGWIHPKASLGSLQRDGGTA